LYYLLFAPVETRFGLSAFRAGGRGRNSTVTSATTSKAAAKSARTSRTTKKAPARKTTATRRTRR
jgi:hypothetical protein